MQRAGANKLILARHSVPTIIPELPASEWHLSDLGRHRCIQMAERLRPHSPQIIVSSTEPKALETAQIVGRLLGTHVETLNDLHEHVRTGVPFFKDPAVFEDKVARFFTEPDKLVLGEETANQTHSRFNRAVAKAVKARPSKTVAICTHGTVMTLFVTRANDLEPFPFWNRLGLPSFVLLTLPGYELVSGIEIIEDK